MPGEVERSAYGMREFAKALGVGLSTAWKWQAEGKFKVVRVGGRTLVPASELRRLLGEAA